MASRVVVCTRSAQSSPSGNHWPRDRDSRCERVCSCRSGGDQHAGTWTFTLDKTTSLLTSVYIDADLIAGQLAFTTPCSTAPLVE